MTAGKRFTATLKTWYFGRGTGGPPLVWRRLQILAAVLALLALGGGCGRPAAPPAIPPVAGYEDAGPDLSDLDLAPLRGRRILLDPGHGGRFRGALGPNGLSEAEVNLGVALYLRGLLEWAGATAYMTRSADVDLTTPDDSTLAGDLARRVALADSLRPDVFVSLHHNSNATRDPVMNETQTYYPAGREGADLDLARAIHKHMVRALGISPARIMAGGFYVLRNAPVPAVLGEPAMLSNPVVEGRLTLARSHEIEARAYFRGLLEYFAGGAPQWTTDVADTLDLRSGEPLRWRFAPGRAGDPELDPSSVQLALDGAPTTFALDPDGRGITWRAPVPPPPGDHTLTLAARNLAGRSAARRRHVLRGPRPESPSARLAALPALPAPWRWRRLLAPAPAWSGVEVPGGAWRARLAGDLDSLRGGAWSSDLPAIPDDPARPLWLEADGAFPLVADAAGRTPWQAPGAAPPETLVWEPLLPALIGKRVVLDPRGGGTDEQGRGPSGTRGSDLDLQVAQRLAALLRGAGCVVALTRTAESWLPDEVKVQQANDGGADLYLTIARGEPGSGTTARHHPGSVVGGALARHLSRALGGGATVAESTEYVLRHTACPALVVELPAVATDEDALADPRTQDAQARALLLAVAATWQGDAVLAQAASLPEVMSSFADARAVDWARWDGNLAWLAPYRSVPLADDTPLPARGDHHILELHAGGSWQLWAVTRAGTQWTGALLLSGP
jgi:N-acetylmuramoyl-L-alanine amidase